MDRSEFFLPINPGRGQQGMHREVKMKTVTAKRRKEYEPGKVFVQVTGQKKPARLSYHQHGTGGNKKIAVNQEKQELSKRLQSAVHCFCNLTFSDSL